MIQRLLIIWFVFGISAAVLVPSAMPGSGSNASPRSFKERALDRLIPFVDESERINKAVAAIEKSLDTEFWEDDFYLVPRNCHKVFDRERSAVKDLHLVVKEDGDNGENDNGDDEPAPSEQALRASQESIGDLLTADRLLALTVIKDVEEAPTLDPKREDQVERELAKAAKELDAGDDKRDADQPAGAILHYKKAWSHAIRAREIQMRPPGGEEPTPTATPLPTPTAVPVANQTEARNLVWAYLSQCVSLDLQQLEAVPVREVWLVQIAAGRPQRYGIWKVDSSTGGLEPHNLLARQWQSVVGSQCDPEELAALLPPTPTLTPQPTSTPTPTPIPTPTPTSTPRPTPVLRSTSDAVATLWAYLVGCFPTLSTSDLESTLAPASGDYIVKDRASNVYGVWRVRPDDGSISPDNAQARTKDRRVTGGTC